MNKRPVAGSHQHTTAFAQTHLSNRPSSSRLLVIVSSTLIRLWEIFRRLSIDPSKWHLLYPHPTPLCDCQFRRASINTIPIYLSMRWWPLIVGVKNRNWRLLMREKEVRLSTFTNDHRLGEVNINKRITRGTRQLINLSGRVIFLHSSTLFPHTTLLFQLLHPPTISFVYSLPMAVIVKSQIKRRNSWE